MNEYEGMNILSIDLEFARMFKKKYKKVAIMEVGMVLIENYGLPSEREIQYSKMFNPKVNVSNYVRMVTGINKSMLKGLPKVEDCKDEIQAVINKADVLLFHGGKQDIRALKLSGFDIEDKLIEDTLFIARESRQEFNSHSLGNLALEFELVNEEAHRALNDAALTLKVYEKLILLKNKAWNNIVLCFFMQFINIYYLIILNITQYLVCNLILINNAIIDIKY